MLVDLFVHPCKSFKPSFQRICFRDDKSEVRGVINELCANTIHLGLFWDPTLSLIVWLCVNLSVDKYVGVLCVSVLVCY